jgi:hypothetical protein
MYPLFVLSLILMAIVCFVALKDPLIKINFDYSIIEEKTYSEKNVTLYLPNGETKTWEAVKDLSFYESGIQFCDSSGEIFRVGGNYIVTETKIKNLEK